LLRPRTGRLLLALGAMFLFVVVLVVVVGEVWVRPTVEDEIADGLVTEFGLDEPPGVEVDGFPLVLKAAQERLDGIDISVEGQVFEGLRVESVDLHIDDVRFKTSELLKGGGTVTISGGDGTAAIMDDDLTQYLVTAQNLPVDVQFRAGAVRVAGSVSVSGITADASVSGQLVLDGSLLRFTPTTVDLGSLADSVVDVAQVEAMVRRQFSFTAPVPRLRGVQLQGVAIGDGEATIDAVFESLTVAY
jgi:hypothetical protein